MHLFHSAHDGNQHLKQVDNTTFGSLLTYGPGSHSVALGYQQATGDTGFTYIAGTDAYVVNSIQWGNFSSAHEKSAQIKYMHDFALVGLPGLSFMTRYVIGNGIDQGALPEGKQWERNTNVGYVVQVGTLKGLAFVLRNASYRTNLGNDLEDPVDC